MEWLTNSDQVTQPLSNVNYHWHTPDFIPKKLSDFLEAEHQEKGPSDSKDSGMTGEKIMLSVYPALNHEG